VIIHVGTHGNLEFLPGKGTGLSAKCFPDAAIGDLPHLYIYNADNPAEGTTAKRRAYATIIDHMQTIMVTGGSMVIGSGSIGSLPNMTPFGALIRDGSRLSPA